MVHETREGWLTAGIVQLTPLFERAALAVPGNLKVVCGWPSRGALSRKKRVLGQCFDRDCSAADTFELCVSPALDDPVEVLATLAHEIAHAVVGPKHGHRAPFARAVKAIGLEGKPTATVPGEAFKRDVAPVLIALGPYPHARITAQDKERTQGTRLLKVTCTACGYTCRVTRKWIESVGTPLCPDKSCGTDGNPRAMQVAGEHG